VNSMPGEEGNNRYYLKFNTTEGAVKMFSEFAKNQNVKGCVVQLYYDAPDEEYHGRGRGTRREGGRGSFRGRGRPRGRGGYGGYDNDPSFPGQPAAEVPHFFRSSVKKDEAEEKKDVKPVPKEDPFGGLKPRDETKFLHKETPEPTVPVVPAAPIDMSKQIMRREESAPVPSQPEPQLVPQSEELVKSASEGVEYGGEGYQSYQGGYEGYEGYEGGEEEYHRGRYASPRRGRFRRAARRFRPYRARDYYQPRRGYEQEEYYNEYVCKV